MGACRCVVTPNHLIHTIKAVLEGIHEAVRPLELIIHYYDGYLIGSVGMNQFMREMNRALTKCWDFKHLVANVPKTSHYKAAEFVYEQLKPTLQFTTWPVDPHFSFVHKAMPAERGTHGWHRQYHTLLKRVRAASVSRWRSRNWWRIQNVVVQPVMTNGALMATLGQISPWRFLSHGTKQCLLGLIGELVGGGQPCVSSRQPFRVNIGSLAAVGFGNTLRTARTKRSAQVFRGGVGSFASLAFKPLQGRIVRIKSTERTLDDNAVADSILGDKFFTSLDSKGLHCWHVVRVFHRSRMMRGAESSCERWGSLMHSLWDSVAGWGPHRIASRLFIREAGLQGSACDEAVVHEIALALRDRMGLDPYIQGHQETLEGAGVSAAPCVDLVIRRGLESGVCPGALRLASCPSTLLDSARAAVERAVR